MEQRYALIRQGSGLWRSLRDEDFEEEEVWDVLRDRKDSSANRYGQSIESSVSVPRNVHTTAARMIPRTNSMDSSSSSNNNYSSHEAKVVQQSAPVNIPDWSKICRKKTKKASMDDDDDGDDNGVVNDGGHSDDEDEDYDSEYNDKVPPHEVIARRLARSQISSFSVFEGVGRTLKGRDLSKVRHAVLAKTGFLESP